jgi:hypothetical protein
LQWRYSVSFLMSFRFSYYQSASLGNCHRIRSESLYNSTEVNRGSAPQAVADSIPELLQLLDTARVV